MFAGIIPVNYLLNIRQIRASVVSVVLTCAQTLHLNFEEERLFNLMTSSYYQLAAATGLRTP